MSDNLVAYSRAGDVFHYRWAARRCLRLIYPNSSLHTIFIEGSSEKDKAGEYVIDVAEYYDIHNNKTSISYYQLKHTTVQKEKTFTLSDLRDTFIGFAKRFTQHKNENNPDIDKISFTIITNRKAADSFKQNLIAIAKKEVVNKSFENTIQKYTDLSPDDLALFCDSILIEDGEGDYNEQKDELRVELSQLIAGSIDNAQINNLISLVQERVLPNSNGEIIREDVLKRFGITSERELYPAPAVWEELGVIIRRQQHDTLINDISNSLSPVIVHAAGGVGKSVFCRQLTNSLPAGSLGIAYDCFGAGSYRNRSESRHSHRDALVQIANELASKGLCDPLIVQDTTSAESIMRRFLTLIETVVKSLRKTVPSAQLFIMIDAADNAEMAAKEQNQSCFAHELLREKMPEGCKLILLCRTERISLLQPRSDELKEFTGDETIENLRKWFPAATDIDGIEFHRLTGGNPRVQANALDINYLSIRELLESLGPSGTSVEQQIEMQLKTAVAKIKDDLFTNEYHSHIDSICLGLASLPPHIPIDVLAKASGVNITAVKSFVSDIGRSLWLSDTSIQFRDEPTETWFRNTFLATPKDYERYLTLLEPLANKSSYIAEILPQLYLQAGQYEKLIIIALSDEYLPENPVDARNIRVQRLQFAFKAALKSQHLKDAVKIAIRAGEEMAGNQRQLGLLQNNIDFLPLILSKEKVQEIAFKRSFSSDWDGSENIYAASLLSGIREYKGEATGYLRASINWLHIFFDEQRKNKKTQINNEIIDEGILELAYSHLNIFDPIYCYEFLSSFKPKLAIFRIVQDLIKRLIDLGRFDEIDEFMSQSNRDPYFIVAATSELIKVGRVPEADKIEVCLDLLCLPKCKIAKNTYSFNDNTTPAILSFLEVCVHRDLSQVKILQVLKRYVPIKASRMVSDSHFSKDRDIFLRALAIRMVLSGQTEVDINDIIPDEFEKEKKGYELENKIKEFKEVVLGFLPWYLLRANVFCGKNKNLFDAAQQANKTSRKEISSQYHRNPFPSEIAAICASIVILSNEISREDILVFYQKNLLDNSAFRLSDRLNLLRAACRVPRLSNIRQELESSTYSLASSFRDDGPEEKAEQYLSLARSVWIVSIDDALAYFDEAVKVVSKFGDEIVQRWNSVVSLAKRASEMENIPNELAYRFIRCAELVGDNVREKYWNRGEAIQICTRMSSGVGISALSRWRDRDIGRFEYEFTDLLCELVNLKKITPAVGWALTRFFFQHNQNHILSICLENESSHQTKQDIFDDAVYLLQVEGTNKDYWEVLKNIAIKYGLTNNQLNVIINFNKPPEANRQTNIENVHKVVGTIDSSTMNWETIFHGLTISTPEDFDMLMQRFNAAQAEDEFVWHMRSLLEEIMKRITGGNIVDFIDNMLLSDYIELYDALHFLSQLPKEETARISFSKRWPNIICRLGERYAHELTNKDSFEYAAKELNLNADLTSTLKAGILSGLENGTELTDSESFFGFVDLTSPAIQVNESIDLIDYSLSRFELHIDDDFGDGVWSNWLNVSVDINKNIAGFVWSALGSPRSAERWNAAHCVRKLAELNCIDVLDALTEWLENDKVDAFGSKQFPFYNLHARQYLLIAFARVSLEFPERLIKHYSLFSRYALSVPHILIQKFASEIALNIEKAFPKTYDEETFVAINNVGKSSFDIIRNENYNFITNSYWHERGEVNTGNKFNFGWDFEQYWYKPLGENFRVPVNQVEDLAADVIINKWKITNEGGYMKDPRASLWNQPHNERETWHDHGNYPQTDNWDFYLSYHAMLVVAAKLIDKMPIIKTTDWYEDDWKEWLSRHSLTREDGKWLSDNRDPLPLKRPKWITEDKDNTWLNNITDDDFIDCLKTVDGKDIWLNVAGGWHERLDERTETFSISSALVAKETSRSLLRALTTCKDPFNYRLPYYKEDYMDIETGKFKLKGWINEHSISQRLDESDPYANKICYPPYSLGDDITTCLDIRVTNDGRYWLDNISDKVSLICESWSSYEQVKDKEPNQSGIKLKASLSFLKHLSSTLDCDIILDVSINREISYKYDRERREYTQPRHKIFILSVDGRLRTTEKDYQLG